MKRNNNHSMTIHMGATQFTVTIHGKDGDVVHDINAMQPTERGRFFGTFRSVMNRQFGGGR
jgi:hypothetical protein